MNDWSLEGSSPPHRTGHEGAGVTVVRVLTRRYGLPRRQLQLPAPPPPQVPLMYAMGGAATCWSPAWQRLCPQADFQLPPWEERALL